MSHDFSRRTRLRTPSRILATSRWTSLLAAALLVAGCSDNKTPTSPTDTGPASITVSVAGGGTADFLALTQTKQFVAVATTSSGTTEDATNKVIWQSSDVSIAIVSPAGVVTALGFGTASIKATLSGRTGELPIVVKNGCLLTLDPPSLTYPAGVNASHTVYVNVTPSDCRWSAVIDASWLTFSPTQTASGSGSFYYLVPYNTGSAERTAHVTVTANDGSTAIHTIRQEVSACVVTLDPPSRSFSRAGGVGKLTVTPAPATCRWTAAPEWTTDMFRIDSGTSGEGPGTVTYTVFPNRYSWDTSFSIVVQGGLPGDSAPVKHTIYLSH